MEDRKISLEKVAHEILLDADAFLREGSNMKSKLSLSEELYAVILSLKTPDEAKQFFGDLLTKEEIEEFSKRWQVARMLDEEIPYTQIQDKTGLSSTTVARISRWLKQGKGGYRLMLDRIRHEYSSGE